MITLFEEKDGVEITTDYEGELVQSTGPSMYIEFVTDDEAPGAGFVVCPWYNLQ